MRYNGTSSFLFVLTGELLHYFFSVMPIHALVEAARTFIANDRVQFCLDSTFLGHLDLRDRQQRASLDVA
jgi:hypothetical protein